MDYARFFETATGRTPYPYQERLGTTAWPDLLDIPTGLGKTAAITIAWLWKLHQGAIDSTRRLVYCLPMRVLVEQTRDEVKRFLANLAPQFVRGPLPAVHILMGGDADKVWDERPDQPAILLGTQDMLLSRALNRGYGVSRYRWPVQFAQLHNDALWVLDETQLMGVAIETSAQLQGLRKKLGTQLPAHTLWMSATLSDAQLGTVDHTVPDGGWRKLSLDASDAQHQAVLERTQSRKTLLPAPVVLDKTTAKGEYVRQLADLILDQHVADTLTLVVLNRVTRAQELYAALLKRGRLRQSTALIHSRFRPPDRAQHETLLHAAGDRIIVATQAIEAGGRRVRDDPRHRTRTLVLSCPAVRSLQPLRRGQRRTYFLAGCGAG